MKSVEFYAFLALSMSFGGCLVRSPEKAGVLVADGLDGSGIVPRSDVLIKATHVGLRIKRGVNSVFSESCVRAESQDVKPVRCIFTEKELTLFPHGELVVQVCPCGRFGRKGSPLVARAAN